MESVPLIPKAKVSPDSDAFPVIRELFQDEIESALRRNPSKKLSRNILTSFRNEKFAASENDSIRNSPVGKDYLLNFSENVYEAYEEHEKELESVRNAEKNVFEIHAEYIKRESTMLQCKEFRDLYILKRQPQFKALDVKYVEKYKLLQGEAGLPPDHQASSDFRFRNFGKWRKRLESISQDSLIVEYLKRTPGVLPEMRQEECLRIRNDDFKEVKKKIRRIRPGKAKLKKAEPEIFRAEPKIVCFTGYKPGEVYAAEIEVRNVHSKGMHFHVKPTLANGPFSVRLKNQNISKKLFSGLSFQLAIEFSPKSLDVAAEDIYIAIEDNKKLLIPLVAYLEPPLLKTHKDVNEFTKLISEKITSSCIECGACFTGDTKVTRLKFRCYRGSGEFFIMSSENWNRNYVNSVTVDNLLEIPPFKVYPVYFKMEKNDAIDLFVEFSPKNSGTHVENIMITCDNGEVRSLDLLGDAIGWHSYFISFQDSIEKKLPVNCDDDLKVKYYLDFKDVTPNGKAQKCFFISNNSNMSFEFQWKIREANITNARSKYFKLAKYQVKIEPENGTLNPNFVLKFILTITCDNAEIGDYRMVLSLYVLNLPYQCIEEDNTIIQPTGLVRNLYSQSLYGEEEFATPSPELLSLQGTYESLQESIKSYVEYQNKAQGIPKQDFCRTVCIPNAGLCAKPLKKSKTYFNIGGGYFRKASGTGNVHPEDEHIRFWPPTTFLLPLTFANFPPLENIEEEGLSCFCRGRPPMEGESHSESCISNANDKTGEFPQAKNEVIWDFVDILVDEIELWVEVSSVRVTIQPTVIDCFNSIIINNPPTLKQVKIINHGRAPVKCKWIKSDSISSENSQGENSSVTVAFVSPKSEIEEKSKSKDVFREISAEKKCFHSGEKPTNSGSFEIDRNSPDEFQVAEFSEVFCSIMISARKPGKFRQVWNLSVNDENLTLKLIVQGTAVGKYFSVSPNILNFKLVKLGTRFAQEYKIKNEFPDPLFLKVNQFNFDFLEETFVASEDKKVDNCVTENFWLDKDEISTKSYYLNARAPGIKCSLLEIQVDSPSLDAFTNQYILTLGDVRNPSLSLTVPRLENAILAPAGMMYVGQTISAKVVLRNKRNFSTFFTWGHPFGCHCRKIKLDISPKSKKINRRQKLTLNIFLTPVDEGIVSHCYVPCFFCRSSEPLILAIVGIIGKVNVTFEIIDVPRQSEDPCGKIIPDPPPGTVSRIQWPIKNNYPNLGLKYVNEGDIMNMKCQCSEVEQEAVQAFDSVVEPAIDSVCRRTQSLETNRESMQSQTEKCSSEENFKESISSDSPSKKVKITKTDSMQKYNSKESFMGNLQLVKAEMKFLNVTLRTPVSRQFVIRNETPVETKFQISLENFGKSEGTEENRIVNIRNGIFGQSKVGSVKKEQPLLLTVDPLEGKLLGHEAVPINVIASGNTWGEYIDFVICQIHGIPPFRLKVFVQIVGHPFYFPMFENYSETKPVLRFQSLTCLSEPASKKIRIVNGSAIPINISWFIFLTQPIAKEEEQEETSTLNGDSNANFDSNHSEESSKSVKVYLPKNASENGSTFRSMVEMREFSQNSGAFESMSKSETFSEKNDSQETIEGEKYSRELAKTSSSLDKTKTESQSFQFRIDIHNFQVQPKEISLEPFEEKKMTVTFDPRFCKTKLLSQEFKATLMGCIKLNASDEKRPGIYYRPCGMNFLSEVLDFNAVVENPMISHEILKGDLKFFVDANEIINSPSKKLTVSRQFFIRNRSQKTISPKIEISPGLIFHVNKVETIDELYRKYDPQSQHFNVKPNQIFEMELVCSVSYKDVIYAYEQLKLKRKKELDSSISDDRKMSNTSKSTNDGETAVRKPEKEPWYDYFNTLIKQKVSTRNSSPLEPKDSFNINLHRMSSKSDNSTCYDYFDRGYYGETEGEFLKLPSAKENPKKSKGFQHVIVLEEEINFIQTSLTTQSIIAELHLSFPHLRVSPKSINFGNVYLGETSVRYCSLINLTGTPTEFKVKSNCNLNEFSVNPSTGSIPSAHYNSDMGKTINIEFNPKETGYFVETFLIYCNSAMEFDCYELSVSGIGTWNEKFKRIKLEAVTKMKGIYSNLN